jgi:hypothetical protein
MQNSRLKPQARPQALAELEPKIAEAKANCERHRAAVDNLSGADRKKAEAYLRIAEDRLAQLYRSREVLVGGEGQEDDGEQPSAP